MCDSFYVILYKVLAHSTVRVSKWAEEIEKERTKDETKNSIHNKLYIETKYIQHTYHLEPFSSLWNCHQLLVVFYPPNTWFVCGNKTICILYITNKHTKQSK